MRVFLPRPRHLCAVALLAAGAIGAAPASAAPRIKEVSTHISNAAMTDIAPATDGKLWITARSKGSLFAVQSDGQVSERPITGLPYTAAPEQIAGGADGKLWSTDPTHQVILRSDTDGASTAFATGLAPAAVPFDIARGGDGNLWFSAIGDGDLGRITPAGVTTQFPSAHTPVLLATDTNPGGDAVWFTTHDGFIGHADAQGAVTFLPLAGTPTGITVGPDGNVWVSTATSILRTTPQGATTTFTAGIEPDSLINDLAAGPDGRLWFSDQGNSVIGRITTDGAVSVFRTENVNMPGGLGSPPKAIAVGPDSNFAYFGRSSDDLIADVVGLVSPAAVPTGTPLPASNLTTSSGTLSVAVNPEGAETSVRFDYGTTTAYGRSSESFSLGAEIVPQLVTANVTDLEPKRTYYFRVVASNRMGEWMSSPQSFTAPNIPIPTAPPLPGGSIAVPGLPVAGSAAGDGSGGLVLGVKAAKVGKKGIVKVRVACRGSAACAGTIAVTARVKGKKSKAVVIATKRVRLAAGASTTVGLRVSATGQRAIRKAGRKGLATLAVITVGETKTRARLTLKR